MSYSFYDQSVFLPHCFLRLSAECCLLTYSQHNQTVTDCAYSIQPTANVPLTATAQSSASARVSASPCKTDSPDWQLTQANWVDANVDSNLYAWWHGTYDTVPSGIPPAPVTSNDAGQSAFGLAQQLVSKVAGIQTFQCQIGADLNCIAPQGDFCKYGKLWTPNGHRFTDLNLCKKACRVGRILPGSRCLSCTRP